MVVYNVTATQRRTRVEAALQWLVYAKPTAPLSLVSCQTAEKAMLLYCGLFCLKSCLELPKHRIPARPLIRLAEIANWRLTLQYLPHTVITQNKSAKQRQAGGSRLVERPEEMEVNDLKSLGPF